MCIQCKLGSANKYLIALLVPGAAVVHTHRASGKLCAMKIKKANRKMLCSLGRGAGRREAAREGEGGQRRERRKTVEIAFLRCCVCAVAGGAGWLAAGGSLSCVFGLGPRPPTRRTTTPKRISDSVRASAQAGGLAGGGERGEPASSGRAGRLSTTHTQLIRIFTAERLSRRTHTHTRVK